MPNVVPARPATPQPRPRPRFPLISTVVAACLAAGAVVGNAPLATHLAPHALAANSSKASAKAASFTLGYIWLSGKGVTKDEGVCYAGPMNFAMGVDATEMGAPFSYRWLVDGKVIETGSRSIPSYTRSDFFFNKKELPLPLDGTTHKVTFQLTSPQKLSKSKKWTMC
ncbi:hypothetical protein ABGB18_33395 [Nonomuraea sp. B12E4]|uniref:hypothetical protein n=1 Tax=Nonomuraea sp. B12E4 TaxID=3153564 RepID=UPI00325C5620